MPPASSRIRFTIASSLFLFLLCENPTHALDFDNTLGWLSDFTDNYESSSGNNPVVRGAAHIGGAAATGIGVSKNILEDIVRENNGVSRLKILSGTVAKYGTQFLMQAGVNTVAAVAMPYCVNPFAAAGCASLFASASSYAGKLSDAYKEWTESFFEDGEVIRVFVDELQPSSAGDSKKKASSVGNLTDSRVMEAPRYEIPFSTLDYPRQATLGNERDERKAVESEAETQLENDFGTEDADFLEGLSYEWDEKLGKSVWKVDGKIVDGSHEKVRKFCSDPSKNCPAQYTEPDFPKHVPDSELTSVTTNTDEHILNQFDAGTASDTIGGMQYLGGNLVVEPGNSIWHGEGGFQGEEYNDSGLNGTSNIKQFKLWDSDELAPQTSSDIQHKQITERVIDEPVPRGSVYMPEDSYSSGDTYSSSSDPNFNRPTQSRNQNRNNTVRNRVTTRCRPGAVDITTPFPVPGRC